MAVCVQGVKQTHCVAFIMMMQTANLAEFNYLTFRLLFLAKILTPRDCGTEA